MNESPSTCTRRDLIRRGSSLFAAATLIGTQATATAPTPSAAFSTTAPTSPVLSVGDSLTLRDNARRIGLAAGGV